MEYHLKSELKHFQRCVTSYFWHVYAACGKRNELYGEPNSTTFHPWMCHFSHNTLYGLICNRIHCLPKLKIYFSSFIICLVQLSISEMQYKRILNDHKGTKPYKCHPTWYLIFLVSLWYHQSPSRDICLSHPCRQCSRSVDNSTSTKMTPKMVDILETKFWNTFN